MPINSAHRSALYVPASNTRAIEKSAVIEADWIIFDLEDSVSREDKVSARQALVKAFSARDHHPFGKSLTAIRCNATDTEYFAADLETIAACRPEALLLPKVSSTQDVAIFTRQAESVSLDNSIASWFMIETARGIAQLERIVEEGIATSWPLQTLVVGHNDIASETGVSLESDRKYLVPWLMQIVLQAKQQGLQVLDSVWNNFRDLDGFKREASQAKMMGFDGKTLIHPGQVEPANHLFMPSEKELLRARAIVLAFAGNEDKNVLSLDGEMVERLHLEQAMRLLEKFGTLQ